MFGPKRRIAPPQKSKPKPVQKPSGTSRIKASLLSLESRLMFDAAAATTEVEVNQEQVAQEQAEAAVSSDRTLVSVSQASVESQGLLQAIASYSPGETPTEIAFVDPTVPDYQALIAGMGSNVQIVMLDGGQDGMERIAASLTGRTGIDAIHIISHGAEGQLSLGTGTLTQASMTGRYADELANIKQALSEQADILVYGCDFAEGQAGQDAATLLSQLTGADVAASVDDTGYAGLGGDWDLELQTGTIETQIVVSNDTQVDWVGLLAGETPPTITSLSGDSRAYSEGAEAVVIESGNAVVADVDSTNFDTGTLTVSFTAGSDSAEDVLAIRNQGTGAGQIGVSGANVTYQGVTIGTFTGGSSGSNLVITLNASATSTAVTALVRNITYQNTDTHAPTTGARTVRFVLTDGDGGTSPNYNATVTVSAVNDAPVLADTALTLTVAEDAGVPSGVVGAPISAFTGGISDVDTGTSKGLAITGSNATNGTWYYTRNGGTTWTAVGTVSNTSALLLADNVSTRLYFAPRANYNGASLAALTVRAWDQTSGTAGTKVSTATNGGTTAFSSATDTVDVTVTAVNDAPTGVPLITGTVTEDQTLTADTSGLGDADGLGTFRYQWLRNGVAIGGATGSTYTLGDADVGTEISVTVSYTDGQGTSESVRSVPTAPVLNVNDAPLLVTNSGSTVAEGGTDTIDVSELAVTDADHAEAQLTYSIGIGPAHGRLEFITAPGISTSSFTQADILANRLVYVHDGSETTSDSFTFTVGDGAGGTLGTTTMTLTIIPVNDAPVITSDGGASMAIVTVAEHVSAVTIVTGADVDLAAQTLTYHISGGVDQALFTINMTTGALSFVAPPNFEVATDANGDNVYVVEVQVIDSQGASTTQTIQVTVTDIAEPLPPNLATLSIPPILLSPTASSPAGPTLVSSTPSSSAEPSPDVLPQSLAPQGSSTTPVELDSTPIVQLPLDSRTAQSDARFPGERGKPMDLAKDQPLFTVRQGGPDPVQDLGPSEVSRPMSELPPATLDEMAVSLEHLAGESEERHPLSTRIVALAGTTLSVAFIAWALHRGALLAGPLWKTSWPGGTPRRKQ